MQNPVLESGDSVTDHGEILEIEAGGLHEALPLGAFDGGEAPTPHRVGAFPEAEDHVIGVEARGHAAMLGLSVWIGGGIGNMKDRRSSRAPGRRPLWPATSEETT